MKVRSLREEAGEIFGPNDKESIERWALYWEESKRRNLSLLESFSRLVLVDFNGKRTLDIGCGTGGLGEIIAKRCQLYVGGDYHFHVLKFASPQSRRAYLQCDAGTLPFPDRSFDYIFAFDVIEHLSKGVPSQVPFLREMHRVLRPLGMVFLTTPNWFYPYDGHSQLYFPHYLPTALTDRYMAWRNPGFLREHHSFSEIRMLTPGSFRRCLRKSRLVLLHDLPCGLDRRDFLRRFPLRGCLAYAGLGWYPHAEFWGILVHPEARPALRLKLKKNWFYEHNQPSPGQAADFAPCIDFRTAPFNHQLGRGWYWYERGQSGNGKGDHRWTGKEAVCYLESRDPIRYIRVSGFSPRDNRFEIWVDGIRVGEHKVVTKSDFDSEYLIPFAETSYRLFEIAIRCSQVSRSQDGRDQRELGLAIASVELR